MTLGEFHAMVARASRRGTSIPEQIVDSTKLAVMWLERNYTFEYMETFRLFQVVQGSRVLNFPTNTLIKSFKFVRLLGTDGYYTELQKVQPQDLGGIRTASNSVGSDLTPGHYFTVGKSSIVFDSVPGSDINGEAMFFSYSDWPVGSDETHPLLGFAADVLLQQTMLQVAGILKDSEMAGVYKVLRDEALKTLVIAEEESKHGGESVSMAYRGG